ncbi:MAG: hypothetical protein APR63_00330 [Desulfuromonas sp. SDB]|nr:MAG: hypothetical protein APR63_00330 [Desulfuromonas sp. SDB]
MTAKITRSDESRKPDKFTNKQNRNQRIKNIKYSYKGNYLIYASGDLHISSLKNSEFFIAAQASLNYSGKSKKVSIKGLVKVVIPEEEKLSEDIFFQWLDKYFTSMEVVEDREGRWLKKWVNAIINFDNPDNRIIRKIKIDWDFIKSMEKLTPQQIKVLKYLYKIGWSKYKDNLIPLSSIKSSQFNFNSKVIDNALAKNPLPLVIPSYHFVNNEGNLICKNQIIRELVSLT